MIEQGNNLNAFISEGDPGAIKFMYVNARKPCINRAPGSFVHGVVGNLHAHMPIPSKLKDTTKV